MVLRNKFISSEKWKSPKTHQRQQFKLLLKMNEQCTLGTYAEFCFVFLMEIDFSNSDFHYCYINLNCLVITWVLVKKCKMLGPVARCECENRTRESAWESSTPDIRTLGVPRWKTMVPGTQWKQRNKKIHFYWGNINALHTSSRIFSHALNSSGFIINSPCEL